MERAKRRRFLLVGFVLACAALFLLGRHWPSEPDPIPEAANTPTRSVVQPRAENAAPASVAAAAQTAAEEPSVSTSADLIGFRGKIVDAVSRRPVPQFEVQLIRVRREDYTEDSPIARSFKSATGRFAWKDAPAGNWRATVSAPGYQMFNVPEFQIVEGKATREVVMPLLHGFAVRGRVYELSTGAGIADASISFRQSGGFDSYLRARAAVKSAYDGAFALDGVPGGQVILTVGAQEHAYRELPLFVDEKTASQEIALSSGGTIAGTVTTAAGEPIKGTVWLRGPGPSYVSETTEAGEFTYSHLRPGRYQVAVDTKAGSARQDFVMQQDEVKAGIVLRVGAGRSVRGTIRGLRPEYLQMTRLTLRNEKGDASASSSPDAGGAYVLRGVSPGRAVMTVFAPSRQLDKIVVIPTDRDATLDIVFPPGVRVSGRVTQDSKPAPNKIVWMQAEGDEPGALYNAGTSAEGDYEIEGVPPGEYRMRASDDVSRRVTIAGDTVVDIEIPKAQLSARILEEGSAVPIVGANVHVRGTAPETDRVRGDTQTDDFGQFVLTGIEPGEIVLLVYKAGYELHREKISYSAPITDKTLTLRKSAGVEVHVQTGSRRFPRGFTLTQTFPGNDYVVDMWMPLDREGVCHVPSALAGTTFQIGRFSGEPIVIEDWDGQSFELP